MRIAVFISGRGSNFIAINENIKKGLIPNTEIGLVFSNNSKAAGLEYATEQGLKTVCLPTKGCSNRTAYDDEVFKILSEHQIDLVCLAGYMRILSETFVTKLSGKIINIHPSILPSFKGVQAQKQALDYGVKLTGCTVHFVDAGIDTGAIIAQRVVPVLSDDTEELLSMRILKEEHIVYSQVIKMFAEGRVELVNNRVIIKEK